MVGFHQSIGIEGSGLGIWVQTLSLPQKPQFLCLSYQGLTYSLPDIQIGVLVQVSSALQVGEGGGALVRPSPEWKNKDRTVLKQTAPLNSPGEAEGA